MRSVKMETSNFGQRKCYKVLRSRRISTTEQDRTQLFERDLIAAVKEGNFEEIKTLLQLGGDVNTTENGCSLLMLSIMYGHSHIAQLLVNTGADVTYPVFQVSGDGEVRKTALDLAAECNMDAVHELIERRILANKNIQMAVEDGNSKLTKSLLQQDADINTPTDNGESLLMRAIRSGRRDVVRLLLDEGIDVAYVLLVQKDVSPGKRKVLRENAKSYAEKYMPDMHPVITDALKPYEEEGLVPKDSEDEEIAEMEDNAKINRVDEKSKRLSQLCNILWLEDTLCTQDHDSIYPDSGIHLVLSTRLDVEGQGILKYDESDASVQCLHEFNTLFYRYYRHSQKRCYLVRPCHKRGNFVWD